VTNGVEVQWVGHATALIDVGGHRILTDPLLTRRVAHLRRRRALPTPDITDVETVLLSHAHLDHLHLPSLRRVHPAARIITPIGTGRLVRAAGFDDVTEVRVGDTVQLDGSLVTVEVVPAAHKHGRGPHSRVLAPPVGYVVSGQGKRVYFPGDTDLFAGMSSLADIDVALLPIWGWGSSLGVGHLDPTRAATATGLIRPGIVVPIHWGTYAPEDGRRQIPSWFDTPPDQFATALADANLSARLHLLQPGESVTAP
jgi:L-ascorbate metabolism protein UlaG (beta-lactamase superfamily)